MANRSGSQERYIKKSNRFILLLGLGLAILACVAYCSLSTGSGRHKNQELPPDFRNDPDTQIDPHGIDFEGFRAGEGTLEAQPAEVDMSGVVIGSQAEVLVTLTARYAPIVFLGMETIDGQENGFVLGGTCEPNRVIQMNESCVIRVMWNPVQLSQIQNTLSVRYKEDSPAVFSDQTMTIPMKGQSTDSKDCVICESPCGKDKEVERDRMASTFGGDSGKVTDDGKVTINDKEYTVQDDLLVDEDKNIVGVVEPEKIPLGLDNKVIGSVNKTGDVLNSDGKVLGRLVGDDTIVDSSLNVLGAAVPIVSVMNTQGKVIGKTVKDGTVVDGSGRVIGRPLVDGSVVDLEGSIIGYLRPYGLVINFTGDVVGGVVPNGTIVNGSQQVVGSVKPNGMAVNPDGELIGAIVPQGVAVGAGCKALGRVLPNGSVEDSFSQIIGKALLDGAIVDEKGVDLGTVVRMGLVINTKGAVVGFVNSEGKAVDSRGAVIGCVNPDGSVSAGTKTIGAVMPKGRVIGRGCQQIGSVYPNGVVMNPAVEVVGQVRPDAYVVNVNERIIGVVVPRGSAIADGCRLLGMITPDGLVVDSNGMSIGCITPEKQVVNTQQEVIGFIAPLGLVVDTTGKLIGRTRPDGKVIDNEGRVIGCVNEDGTAVATDAKTVVGQLEGTTPGKGVVVDADGNATDMKVVGNDVFDGRGEKVGELKSNGWVVNNKGEGIGVIPPDGVIFSHDGLILGRYSQKTGIALTTAGERFGFVLPDYSVLNSEKDTVIGVLIPDKTPFMDLDGHYMATMTIDGVLQGTAGETLGVIKSNGTVVNRAGQVIGVRMPQGKVFSTTGKEIGTVNGKGEVLSSAKSVIGHILGNGLALSNDGQVLGGVFPEFSLPMGADGLLGSLTYQGKVNDSRGRTIGTASPFGTIFGDKGNLSGRLLRVGPYVDTNGKLVGWANFNGGVNDRTGATIGTATVAGVALNSENRVLGTLVPQGVVVDLNGGYLSSVSTNGQVLKADGQSVGQVSGYRLVANEKEGVTGQLLPPGIAINADGGLIGWTRFDGAIEDGTGVVGRVTLDGRVIHADGTVLGTYVPLGTLVLGEKNYLGIVDGQGAVVNGRGEKVARLTNGTYVLNDAKIAGRLMTDSMAVTSNTNGRLIGMAGADGVVMVAGDNKPLGNITMNGLVVDLTKKVVAGQAPVGLPIGMKLGVLGVPLASGQAVAGGKVVGSGIGTGIGAAYSADGSISGGILPPGTFIDRNGAVIGRSAGTAVIVDKNGKKLAEYMPFGTALTPDTIWAGGVMPTGLAVNDEGYPIGVVATDGTLTGRDGLMMGRILSDGTAVGLSDKNVYSTMPYVGHIVKQGLPFGYRNAVLGRTTVNGDVVDASDKKLYRILDDGMILGTDLPVDGAVLSFNPATGHDGKLLGVLDGDGNVVSYDGTEVGKIAVNGAVKGNHKYKILGALVPEQLVVNECKVLGQVSYDGRIVNGQGSFVGRITPDKWAVDSANNRIGRLVRVGLVASPTGDYIGRTLPDSTVVDLNGVNIGCARNDGTVVNSAGTEMGSVVETGVVIDEKGNPKYRIKHDGTVVDKSGRPAGRVLGDGKGTVINEQGDVMGRAVSRDDELMFNSKGEVEGTYGLDGMFTDPKGIQQFQVLPDGTIIDPNTGIKIAEVTPEGVIRDPNGNEVSDIRVVRGPDGKYYGLVLNDGTVLSPGGQTVGTVEPDGTVRDPNGNVMQDLVLSGVGLNEVAPAINSVGGTNQSDRRILLGDNVFDVTLQGSLVDKDGNIVGYMGEDGRPYSLDNRLLTGRGETDSRLPPPVKKLEINQEQKDAMDVLRGKKRGDMKSKIRSFNRLLPDGRTLARARKKEDLDWGEPKIVSTYPVDMSRMILRDKAIPAVLAHSIDSRYVDEVPVTAIVERHIYAEQGRRIIIPAGSRLIGIAEEEAGSGHVAKMNITWTRLIRPDGSAFSFNARSGDAQGRGGVAAYLDEQLLKKYGRPVLQSTLTSAIAFITATNDDMITKENGDQVISAKTQAANDARSNFIDSMSQIFQQLLDESMRIKPVVFVPAGTRLTVFSNADLWLRSEIEDELEYDARFGAEGKAIKGTSQGDWVSGRRNELAEEAGDQGIYVDPTGGIVADDGTAYYDPAYTEETGGAAIYNGGDLYENQSAGSETVQPAQVPKPTPSNRITEPIFPRTPQQGTKKMF